MSKTNIDYLRDIIKDLTITNVAKQTEAFEFLNAIAEELNESDEEAKYLKRQLESEDEPEYEFENVEEVGLDTIFWELQNDNLRIRQEMENFFSSLKKKYIGVAA